MLETIWFILWGILWAIYFVLDGFDLGIGTLYPFLASEESGRQIIHGSIAPYWDGNEVWLITAGGVTFAAFPTTYAVMFSSLYSPLLLILFALIIRGVSVELRMKTESEKMRRWFDRGIFVGSFLPPLLLGVAFANIFRGIPIDELGIFHGNLLTLLNPYGLTGGTLFMLLFAVHGSLWLAVKTEGEIQKRASIMASNLWLALVFVAVLFLMLTALVTDLYVNYLNTPVMFVIPGTALIALVATRVFIARDAWWKSWVASAFTIAFVTLFGVGGLYPRLFPSSLDPSYSLTAFNSSSSPLTLKIMLGVAGVMVPIVLAYQFWAYIFFRGKTEGY